MIQNYLAYLLLIIYPFHWAKTRLYQKGRLWAYGTNACINSCGPHWKHICCNKWHQRCQKYLHHSKELQRQTWHSTKTVPGIGEASWTILTSSIFLLSGGTVQLENTYSCILKVTCQIWEYTNHRYPKLVSTNQSNESDSALTNSKEKEHVRDWSV